MEDVIRGGGEGAPESNDDSRRVGRIAVAVAVAVIVLLVIWWLWPRFGVMPNVVGMNETAARAAIEQAGYSVGIVATRTIDTTEAGRVLAQVPPAGLRVAIGQQVDVTISQPSGAAEGGSSGPPVAETSGAKSGGVIVPGLTGMMLNDGTNRLQVIGLPWSTTYSSSGMAAGMIVHQSPSPGVVVPADTVVKVVVSSGTPSRGSAAVGGGGPYVPSVVGLTSGRARNTLAGAGYGMRTVFAPSTSTDKGLVFWQSVGPGPDANAGGSVTVWISTGVPDKGAPYPKPPDIAPVK